MSAISNASGLIEYLPETVEKAPEGAGLYLIVASGQKVLYVGDTEGIREALWMILEEQPFGATEYFNYIEESDAARREAMSQELIAKHKPPHNLGYSRFRNEEVYVSKQATSIRNSAPNPSETI